MVVYQMDQYTYIVEDAKSEIAVWRKRSKTVKDVKIIDVKILLNYKSIFSKSLFEKLTIGFSQSS